MAFPDIRPGIHANLRAYTDVDNVMGGMPNTIQRVPAWVTQFQSMNRKGQTMVFESRWLLHAILENQVNDIAESALDIIVPKAMAAFSTKLLDANGHTRSTLGGAAEMSLFERVSSGDIDGYITFGSGDTAKLYRHILFELVVKTFEVY